MALFFSKNTTTIERYVIVAAVGISVTQQYDTYLGLPVTPRLYLMKGESGNLQLPLGTTILSSISSGIINLAAEYFF
jgi:hypothetical protein